MTDSNPKNPWEQEKKILIGDIPTTLMTEFGAVKVVFDMHRNGHEVPSSDPKYIKVQTYIDAIKNIVPLDLLNRQEYPKFEGPPNARTPVLENGEPVMESILAAPSVTKDKGAMTLTFLTRGIGKANTQGAVYSAILKELEALRAANPPVGGFASRIADVSTSATIASVLEERVKAKFGENPAFGADVAEQTKWIKDTAEKIADALSKKKEPGYT